MWIGFECYWEAADCRIGNQRYELSYGWQRPKNAAVVVERVRKAIVLMVFLQGNTSVALPKWAPTTRYMAGLLGA